MSERLTKISMRDGSTSDTSVPETYADDYDDYYVIPGSQTSLGVAPWADPIIIHEPLGCGGFCQVYSAIDANGNKLALKMEAIYTPYLTVQREIEIFQHLMEPLAKTQFRHIAKYYGWKQLATSPPIAVLVMDQYRCNLYHFLYERATKQGKTGCPLWFCQKILRQLAESLLFLKRCEVIHADLKLENVMLTDEFDVKLVDFGGAIIGDRVEVTATTLLYRAPELILELETSFPADVWATGWILAELFVGLGVLEAKDSELSVMRMIEMRIGQFPQEMIDATPKYKYFDAAGRVKTLADVAPGNGLKFEKIEDLVMANHFPQETDEQRAAFLSVLKGMLTIDPAERITPEMICEHPFLSMELPKTGSITFV